MTKKTIIRIVLILLPIILICGIFYWIFDMFIVKGDQPLDPEVISTDYGAYEYNPETILKDIHDGKKNILWDINYELGLNQPEENMTITNFTEDEFYEISRYITENEMEGDIEEWKLVEIRFTFYDCVDETVYVSFSYERPFIQDGKKFVQYYNIGLSTYSNTITWYEKVEKRDQTKKGINWDKLIYKAYDVKTIADNNGGSVYSQEPNNTCGDISIGFYGQHSRWYVDYYDNDNGYELFSIEVDPKTGKVKK